ncbi:MAG: two-component system sensor histidine kinase CreC [Desulfoprunum sp.]|nr:two-component system sensor histidine kinase CreC [Desulfoprunum sp.]
MKIRTRIFLVILATVGLGFSLLVNWVTSDLKPQFRESTEEPLVDTTWVLAAMASAQVRNGGVDADLFREAFGSISREITPAPIYDFIKTTMDLRIYMTDAAGKVIFDSAGRDEGADYSRWNDVVLTLQGKYGTRTSSGNEMEPEMSVMYVAAPIKTGDNIVGVISVGKPTRNVDVFIEKSRKKVILGGLLTFSAVVIATLVVSAMVTRPIERLIAYARSVSQGEREPLPKLGGGEVGQLGKAFEEMRSALEGKRYVENYVQTLTHEMKSPLAAIQGAVELLREKMPVERRERFLGNIENEGKRMQQLIERLLLLSSIENRRTLQEVEEIDLLAVVEKTAIALAPICMARGIDIKVVGDPPAIVRGEAFLVEQAVANIFQNALEFSPQSSTIWATVNTDGNTVRLTVEDQGPGVPDYALPRVFERFYSLNRPDTGKKSSGLGLSLVREAMLLHGGNASLENLPDGGAIATLIFTSR